MGHLSTDLSVSGASGEYFCVDGALKYWDINPASHRMVTVIIRCGAALCFYIPAESLTAENALMVQRGQKQCL